MIRIIDTGLSSGAENMAWDEALLQARVQGIIPDTLRYLRFFPPVALVGYHQAVAEEIRLDYCHQQGIEINRRITGGGAIFFDEGQLGWELIASRKTIALGLTMEEITGAICRAAVRGLETLGLEARFRPRNDIEIQGRKISGTGAALEGDVFLFQGTLLIDFNLEHLIKALRIPTEKLNHKELTSARERVTSLKEQLGVRPPLEKVKEALEKGFNQELGLRFQPGEITGPEESLFRQRLSKMQSAEWIQGSRIPFRPQEVLRSIHKEDGGLIRAAVKVDLKKEKIKDILITGDFFIYPRRAIYDLEAALKDVPIKDLKKRLENFFTSPSSPSETGTTQPENVPPSLTLPLGGGRAGVGVELLGLTPNDFLQAICLALDKRAYPKLGFSFEEADWMTVFNGTLPEILKQCDLLLLPYCAKLPECDYRTQDGCIQCGQCTIGEAFGLAESRGLKVLTIQNYEHLVETLEQEKQNGVRAYLGCCCDAFQLKRQEAFKESGLPALLLDIENTTCYELNKEKEAYLGAFENQTYLRIDLLKKVLNLVRQA
jgi:lipoate---protein ligase